jgi:hypothetical protein
MPDGAIVELPENPTPQQKQAIQAKVDLITLRTERDALAANQRAIIDKVNAMPMGSRKGFPDPALLEGLDEKIRIKESEISRHKADAGGAWDKISHYGRQAGSAVLRGLGGIAALAAEAGNAERASYGRGFDPGSASKSASQLGSAPTTQTEKYVTGAIEGATGSLAGGGGLATRLATGAAANVGGEAAATALGDTPLSRALGSIAGGLSAGLVGSAKTSRGAVVRAATEGVSEAELRLAQAMQKRAMEVSPTGLNTAQALQRSSPLDAAISTISNSPQGGLVRSQLQAQPKAAEDTARKLVTQLPGRFVSPGEAADNLQSAATESIQQLKDQRSQVWKAVFGANDPGLKDVTKQAYSTVVGKIERLMDDVPNTPQEVFLRDLRSKMINSDGNPITDASKLNAILLAKSHELKKPTLGTPGFDAGSSKFLQSKIQEIRQDLGDAFQPYRMANQAYAKFSDAAVGPAKKGVIGQIAKNGAMDDKASALAPMIRVFEQGTAAGVNRSDILKLEHGLRTVPNGPDAFQTAFKVWASGKIDAAAKSDSNRQSDGVAAALSKSFGAMDESQAAGRGIKDSLVAVARSRGLPDQELVKGWRHAMEFISASSVRPSSVTPISSIQQAAQGSKVSRYVGGATPIIGEIRHAMSNLRGRDAYQFLDKLLTTPEGTETLIKLSKSPSMGKSAQTALATFMGSQSQSQTTEGN